MVRRVPMGRETNLVVNIHAIEVVREDVVGDVVGNGCWILAGRGRSGAKSGDDEADAGGVILGLGGRTVRRGHRFPDLRVIDGARGVDECQREDSEPLANTISKGWDSEVRIGLAVRREGSGSESYETNLSK